MTEEIKGVYYESKKMEVGTMATKKVHDAEHTLHYYCKSEVSGEVNLYYLKPDGTPTAIVMETITLDAFNARFKDCSTHKCEMAPKTEEDKKKEAADKKVAEAQHHLDKEEYHAAAFEFGQAIKQDDKNLKAHLGKGKAHMATGDVDEAKKSFAKLSEIDDLYDKENKHIFNEYGIELRKGEMYDLAIENYEKAISIDPEDEALYFNMARAHKENGSIDEALQNLEKALELQADFQEAQMLYNAIKKVKPS